MFICLLLREGVASSFVVERKISIYSRPVADRTRHCVAWFFLVEFSGEGVAIRK